MTSKKYVPAIDALRVVAILMVILIHTTSKTLGVGGNDVLGMPLTFLVNQVTRGAVALFILISGFVLENSYDGQILRFYKKRAGRILLPYLSWSLIYYFFVYTPNPNSLWLVLLGGGAAYQLYFIPALLILYLLFPWLRTIKSRTGWIMLIVVQLGLLYWDYSVKPLPDYLGPLNIVLLNYLIFLIGIVAAQNQEKVLKLVGENKGYFGLASVLGAIYLWIEGGGGYLSSGNYLAFYSQRRISILVDTVVLAATLFWVFRRSDFFKKIAELSFFVFFVHLIFLEQIGQRWPIMHQANWGWLFFLGVTGLSFGVAAVVHRIKWLIKIFG